MVLNSIKSSDIVYKYNPSEFPLVFEYLYERKYIERNDIAWYEVVSCFNTSDVSYYNGRTVGIIALTPDWILPNSIHISVFEISPKYKNNGFGSETLAYLIDLFDHTNFISITLQIRDNALEHFYEKFGFIMTGNADFPYMVKYLNSKLAEQQQIIPEKITIGLQTALLSSTACNVADPSVTQIQGQYGEDGSSIPLTIDGIMDEFINQLYKDVGIRESLNQGVQDTFRDRIIREFGCYFLCILKQIEIEQRLNFDLNTVQLLKQNLTRMGKLSVECDVLDPVFIYNYCSGFGKQNPPKQLKKKCNLPKEVDGNQIVILENKKPGKRHFVLWTGKDIWDPLNPTRRAAGQYVVSGFRHIV